MQKVAKGIYSILRTVYLILKFAQCSIIIDNVYIF